MSDLKISFTFRLTEDDKASLTTLADRLQCDRGEALRRLLRSAHHLAPGESGQFVANGHHLRLRLAKDGK